MMFEFRLVDTLDESWGRLKTVFSDGACRPAGSTPPIWRMWNQVLGARPHTDRSLHGVAATPMKSMNRPSRNKLKQIAKSSISPTAKDNVTVRSNER